MNTDPLKFKEAQPFPHLVLDGACPEEILEAAMPAFDEASWQVFNGTHETKAQALPPPAAVPVFHWMNSLRPMLEEMTGISGLELDLLGGGLHQTKMGGRLDMHVDFNRHPDGRYRRLNMLLFANKNWQEGHGGILELGIKADNAMGMRANRIEPIWNRLVVFQTGEDTWHGHPWPWANQEGPRRSFAGYWYTREKPATVGREHSTVWADD